jgi:hypothetical protein
LARIASIDCATAASAEIAGVDAALEVGERDHLALPAVGRLIHEPAALEKAGIAGSSPADARNRLITISGWAKLRAHA